MLRRFKVEVGYGNIIRILDVEAKNSYEARECAYAVLKAFRKWDCVVYDVTEVTYTTGRRIIKKGGYKK